MFNQTKIDNEGTSIKKSLRIGELLIKNFKKENIDLVQ